MYLFLYPIGNKHSREKDFIKHKTKSEKVETEFDCSQCSKTFSSLKKKENHTKNVHDKRNLARNTSTKSPKKEKIIAENDSKEFIKKQVQVENESDDDIIELVSQSFSSKFHR